MHSLILVDHKDQAITPSIVWADNRAATIASGILKSSVAEMLYEQSGTPIHAMSPLCKIIWFRENKPELFQQTAKFISIKEYIWHKLFNIYEVDYSIASATGLMDIQRLCWNTNALSIVGITEAQLSVLVNTNHVRYSSTMLGLTGNTPFIIAGSDGCMANLGSFAVDGNAAALTIGTSGAIRLASQKPLFNFEAMTFNYLLDDKTFICGGPTNNGGVILKWFSESILGMQINSADDYTRLLSGIENIETGSSGLIFLPYVFGERAPLWNSSAQGVFFGIQAHHTQKHFVRAIIEGIAMALYSIYEKMNFDVKRIHVSGGFVRSSEWLQIISDVFNKELHLLNSGDASALGAAYLGMKTLGIVDSFEVFQREDSKVVLPRVERHVMYQAQYKKFHELYDRLSPIMN
jgi:gluconokinase